MNPEMLEDVYNASQHSQGSAQRELDTYLDSIEAKFAKLQNRLQELAYTSISSDFIKTIVDGLTKAVELATKLIDTMGVLPTILGSIAGFVSFKQKQTIFDMIPGIKDIKKMIQSNNLPSINDIKLSSYQQAIDGVVDLFPDSNQHFDIDFSLSGVETAQASLSDFKYEVVDTFDVVQESALDAGAIIGNFGSSFSGLISGVKAFGLAFGKAFISMAAIMLATKAIQMATSALHDFIHRDEIMIQKGKEATEAITERSKAFKDYKDQLGKIESEATGLPESKTSEESIKKIAKEYDKLHDKVNASTNKNESLSTEDYERYLELSNKIAEQFPSLVKGWDSQGNAILDLGSSADTAEDAIMRLYEAERRAANVEIASNIQASYDGFAKQIEQKESELNSLQHRLDSLNSKAKQNDEMPGGISSLDTLDFNSNIIRTSSPDAENRLREAFATVNEKYDLVLSNIASDIDGLDQTFQVQGFELLTPDQQAAFRESLKTALQSGIESQGIQLAEEITNQMGQINAAELFIQDQKKNITSTIGDYLSTSDIFAKQSATFRDAFLANIGNLDISKLMGDAYSGDIMSFMYGEIIEPLYKLQPEAQAAIDGLFKLDPEKTSVWKYIDTVQKQLTAAFGGDEKLASEWRQKLGFDQIIQDITDAQLDISNEFKDQSGKILEDSGFDPSVLATQTLSDLKLYADLVRTHSYETWQQLQEDFEKQKERVYKTDKTRTLADVLSDETFKSDVDYANYEGNLSSLTSALETLRTEGSLTAETLVSLQKSMPSLTDFSEDSLKDTAFKQLDAWIQRIREEMTTMSEEGKEQTQTMIQNMINQYGDLGLTLEDIYDEYWQVQGVDKNTTAGYEQIKGQKQFLDAQVEELRSRLAAEGKELDTHVLYTLIASDQFSGTAEEIYNKYNDAEVTYHVKAEYKQAERDLEIAESRLQVEQAERSKKEANGQILTPSDYQTELNILNGKVKAATTKTDLSRRAWKDKIQENPENKEAIDNAFKTYQADLADQRQAEAELADKAREQAESDSNKILQELENSNNSLKEAQNKVTEAEKNGGKASTELYEAVASEYDNQADINRRLGDAYQDLVDNADAEDVVNKSKWQGQANDYYASAIQAENEAKESRNQPILNEYNQLQTQAEQIQREITRAEQNHQKVSTQTYRSLIDNGEMQIRNLQSQQSEVEKYSEDWWNLQNSIDSAQDSIYDWSKTMDQLVVTQASELASTLSNAMSEQFSDTGLTSDTMDALLTAFSDLTGNNLDISDAFYNTADGIKVNTQAIEELTEAEFDLQSAQLQQQIDMVQEALERNPGNSALNQKLQQLMQTQAQYFAQYEEMRKALSYNGAMSLAEQTANQGANFDSNINRYSTYAEAYKKGYVGTDDFEAWTAYLDVYGRTGKDIYEGVKDKAERYFGQKKDDSADEIAGLQNFLNDLEKLGYATKSETTPGGYDLKFDSYENASKAMGMGQEWFEDMLGKLEERGFDIMSVSSLTDSALQMQDLEAQRKQALATYMDMRDRGASKEDLSSQLELVDELGTKMQRLSTLTEDWQQTTEDARKMNFANLQSNLAELERLASETEDEATKNLYREEAAKEAAEFGYTLKEGGFSLSEADAADYASRFVGGTLQSPLSAAQMGYGPEVADKYVAMINKVSGAYQDEDSNVQSLVDTLNEYDKDKLWKIDHADGKWSDGEKEVEQLCDALGVGYDNAKLLIDALAGLGLIKTPDSITSLPDTFAESKQQLDGLLATARKGSGAAYQIDTSDDYTGKTLDQLRTQQSEVRQMLADTVWDETNQGAKDYLEQLDRNVTARIEIETVLSKGDTTLKQLQDLDDEQLAAKFNVDVNSDEFIALKQQLEQLQNSYDLEIHIDDTQFDQLMTALVGEDWETTVNVKADTEEYEETVSSLEPPDGTNTGEQGPDSTPSNPVQNATQSGQNAVSNFLTGNNVTTTENETGYTGFTEEQDQTEQTAENVSVNAQNVQVNDDTNTPGTLANGESLTPEQRQEYSSTPETEPKLYGSPRDPSLYSSTDYDFVGVHENGANPIAQIWDSLFGGSKESEQVETAVINATTAEVNSDTTQSDDTNTPGTLSKGESLTSEQRSEYSSTSETPEGEAYEPESQTSTAVINADVAELNADLPNETDPNYTSPVEESSYQFMNPSNPFEYGQPQPLQYQESWQSPAPTESATPGEMSTGDMSVNAGSVTVSGPVEIPKTSTDTPQPSYTPAPTSTPSPTADASVDETSTKVTVEADVTPAEEAIAGLGETPVTVGVDIEAPQTEEFQTVLDRVGNLGQQPIEIQLSTQDNATEDLQNVEDKSNEVDALNPTVTAETQDNASSVLGNIVSSAQEVDAQAPNVGVEATDNASSTLDKIKGLADDVESTDPNVSVSASTGNTISTLTNILNTVNQLPPSRIINITTKYTTIGEKPGQASGTFHPAHALGTVKSAFADGTVGEAWNKYSRENGLGAYAGGSDVTLKHDQFALTSEVGQESIVRDGHWYLLDSHPHMEQLKKGDIVFNASQTKDLLEHGRANGHGRVAYANGTAYNSAPAFVKMTEELRKEKTGNPKIVKSTNGKGHVEIVNDNNWVDKVTSAVTRMGQEISQALDTPDDNTNTWSDDYAQIHLLNDQSAAIQANTAATQNNTKVKNQEATYVDFAEKVMNRLSKATARLQNRITEFTTYTFKKNTLRSELDSLADEIAAASAALPVYAEYLEMLRNTPIQHESSSDGGGGGGGSDSGSDSSADDTAETDAEAAATRLETAKSNLKAAKQNLKNNYKLSDEQSKKLKNNKKIDESEIKGSNKKNAASVYNDALKQYKQLKKQEDTATETTAKETSKAAKNTEQNTAEVAQTSSQTASHTGAVVSSAEAVEASGYDIASYTELGAAAGTDTVTILQTISGQIAGLSTQIADISVNVNIDGGSASVSSGGGGSKSSGSSDDDDGGSGGSKNGKDVDDYSWSKKNQEAIENGEKIDISTIDPSKKNKIAAAKAYNKSLKNGGGSSSSSGSSNKSSGSSNKSSSGNVKSKSGDGGVSVSSGSGKGHTASAEEKQFKKEMKAAAKDVKNSYTLTSDQQKAIKKGETLSTKGITDQTKKDAFKAYNQAVKKYNNARLSTSVSSNAPISPNNDPLHNENMRALGLIEAAQAKAGKGGGGGGGGGGSIGGIDPSSVPASSSDKAAESIYDTLNGDYLGEFANILEDNDLIAILGLDKDLASALEEYDEFLGKLEDTKDSLEQLYQQVVSVWDELAQAPLEEADRQIEQLELGIDGLTAALGRLDNAMAGGSTLNVLDTIRETEKAAADYTATSQAVLDAIRDVNADKTDNAAQQVEIRRWAVDEAKQVLEDAQKAMDEVTRDADEKIAEYKKTREETEKKLAEAQATATSTAAAVSSLEQNEYVKRYKEIEAKKALAPTGGIFSKLLGIKETEPRQNGFLSDDMPSSPYASILSGLGARQNSNDPLKRIFGFNSGADGVIEQYTEAVKKAGEATAEVTAQQSALRESTLLLAQAELDKTLREEMQAEILQQAKLAYDQAQTALAQAESEYAAQYIQEVVDNFSAVEDAFESVLRYQKSLDENEELYVKNAEERGNRITAAMRQFQSGNLLGQTATLRAEIAALNEELSGDRLVYGSKEWNDLMSQILDKETELNDLLNQQHGILLSILSDVKEHYSVLIDHLEQVNRLNDAWIDTAKAIGDYETELSYIQRYAEQQEMVALYLQQSADAQEQFDNLVARGELIAGTDEYIAKQTEVLSLINDAKNAQNDLREIEADRIKYTIERYEELLDRVDNYVDIIKALGGLISEAAKFDYDTGNLTDMGQASIAIEMTAWQENTKQLRDVLEERQRLRDEFASNPNFGEKEFAEALDANDKQIQEYLSNIKGAADNIVEIGITIAEKQLAAINKTIDARKKALSLEQDYYNYDKSLKNSTKDIELLNAQIRALEGVSDAESKAMKARLEAQRDELQDNLNDQVREHVVNLQTEGLTEMQEQLADNLDEWRNELQGDIQKQLDYINSINMSASNIEAALNKLVLGASNGVATLSDVETAVKENGLLTSTVSDVNKQYEEGHAKAVATKQAQDAGAELAARIQGAINTLGTSVSTANIDKFTQEWAAVADKANYNIGSTDQTGKDIQALINQLKSDVSQNQSMKDWVDAIAAVKSPTYNYSQAQIDAMAKSGNVDKQGYNSVITNAKAVWDKMSAEQKKAYNEVAGAFHAGKTVDQMLATYTNAVDSLNKAVATNVEKAKAEMARKAAEEAKRKAEEEAKRRAEEEAARKKAEEEARKKAEEAAKKKAEEEAKKKAEEEAKQKDPRYRLMGIYNGGGGSYDGPGYSEMLYGVQSTAAATSTKASSEKVYVLTPKADDYILKQGEVLVDQKKHKKKATGTRHAQKGMTLTQEKGGEIITTKDGVLVPLKAGDGVIPANLTDKLFRMAMDYPNIGQTVALPEMKPAETNVTVSYGSLLTVNGNVDKDALPGLQDILKQAYQYTSKQLAIDAKKAGMRQARY